MVFEVGDPPKSELLKRKHRPFSIWWVFLQRSCVFSQYVDLTSNGAHLRPSFSAPKCTTLACSQQANVKVGTSPADGRWEMGQSKIWRGDNLIPHHKLPWPHNRSESIEWKEVTIYPRFQLARGNMRVEFVCQKYLVVKVMNAAHNQDRAWFTLSFVGSGLSWKTLLGIHNEIMEKYLFGK